MEFFQGVGSFISSRVVVGAEVLAFTWSELVFQLLIPVVIYVVFYKLVLLLARKWTDRSKWKEATRKKIVVWIRRILRIVFLILVITLVGRLLGAEIFSYLRMLFQFLSKPFFETGNTRISLITIILAVPIFYLAAWAAKGTRSFFDRSLLSKLTIDEARKFSVSNLIRYGSLVVFLLIGLSFIGINLSSLAVIFGVLGIGLGFGLQGMVANFFAGIVIILTRPIKEGDRIFVLDSEGIVINIRTLSTVINTILNETIIVPNSQITGDKVYNFTHDDRSIVIENSVQIAYTADLEKAVEVLDEIGRRIPFRRVDKEPIVRVRAFEDSGILLKVFTWIVDVNDKYASMSWANMEIWREFKRNGIEIPFPQVDLHFRNALPGGRPD
jgi:potassium-dependent mechanosensitive channel